MIGLSIRKDLTKNKSLYLMVSPMVLFFLIFSYLPIIGIYYAFTRFNFNGGLFGSPFIGFKNFEFLFKSGIFFNLTKNTIVFNLVFIFLGNSIQLLTAIMVSEIPSKVFRKVSQSALFLPYFISFVLLGAFVYNLFNYDYGTLNMLLKSMNLDQIDFYNTTGYWKYIITFFHIWKWIGYGTVVYLSSIMSIDQELYEAAKMDGASVIRQIRHITVPLLKPTFIMLILFSLGNIMKGQFELFYQLVGRNGALFEATDIIDTYVYRSLMVNFDIGMGTAAGLYQSVFGFIVIMAVNYFIKKSHEEYALF